MTTNWSLVALGLADDRDPDSVIDSIDPEEATQRMLEEATQRMLNQWRRYFLSAQPIEPIVVDDRRWYPYPSTSIVHIHSTLSPPLRHPGALRQRTHASDEKKARRQVNRAVEQDERPARMQRDAARRAQQRRARRGH